MGDNLMTYSDEYFANRNLTDERRLKQFDLDFELLSQYIGSGSICDVGCSTGEFLRHIDWQGPKYGMEINQHAISIASDIIDFDKNIETETDFFDVIVFRGTLQLVDRPFEMLRQAYTALKPNGILYICATPNLSSPLYKLKKNLPFIEWDKINFVPESKTLCQALSNIGYSIETVKYPYLQTPYANIFRDHLLFLANIFSPNFHPHAFWKSSMSIIALKPNHD